MDTWTQPVDFGCDVPQVMRYHEFLAAQLDHGEAGCPSVEQPSLYSDWARKVKMASHRPLKDPPKM